MIEVTKQLLTFLDSRSRVQLYLLFIPMFIMAILEMASIGMILPLLQVLMGESGGKSDYLQWIPGLSPDIDSSQILIIVMAIFASLFVIKNIGIFAMVFVINKFTTQKLAAFIQRMFGLYLHRPYTFHLQRNSSEILYNLTQGAPIAFDGLRLAMTIILEATLAFSAGLLLVIIEPEIIGISAVFLVLVGILFYRVMAPIFRRWGERVHKYEALTVKSINQGLGAIKDVKVLNCYTYLLDIYRNQTNHIAQNHSRSLSAQHLPRLFVESVVILGFLVLILVLLEIRGSATEVISVIGLFGMAALRLMPSMNRILASSTELKHRATRVESLYNDLNEGLSDNEIDEPENTVNTLNFTHDIQIENIEFKYKTANQPVLRGVSFSIKNGESVGIVGPSGSGKTTLVDVIMGLLHPTSGRLLVDNEEITGRNLKSWQSHLGYVPQNIYLTDDTLRRNIAFGIRDEDVDDTRVMDVVGMAWLDGMLSELPQGLDTIVGEQGIRLSGGQRQRIGIARALYRNPDFLILDEATSALDNETEREISAAIESLSGEKTVLVIAHRLSTVRKCDRLIFIEKGKISDVGAFDDLMKRNSEFRHLVELGTLELSEAST